MQKAGEGGIVDVLEAIRSKRAVRLFSDKPVPEDLMQKILDAGRRSQSSKNSQPWQFVVVTDPGVKARIRAGAENEEELLYRERASQEYLDALEPIGTDWSKPHLTEAPVLIVVFEEPWSIDSDGEKKKNYYVRESVGIAVGFLLVALHNAGVATLTHAPSPMGFLNDILGRPSNERPFIIIAAGYPAAGATVPELERKSFDAMVEFVEPSQ